jgi:hypothetical protein
LVSVLGGAGLDEGLIEIGVLVHTSKE